MSRALNILCMVGSPKNAGMADLSELYARGCLEVLKRDGVRHFQFVHISPDEVWRRPASLRPEIIASSPALSFSLSFSQIVTGLSEEAFDIGLPQMFCEAGMTTYRSLFALLGLPFLGNLPLQMGLTADKSLARAIVAASGVAVPEAVVLRRGQKIPAHPDFPIIVKPVCADNSEGVAVVRAQKDLVAALDDAFVHDDAALIEQFIPPGRELRCGVIERQGRLVCLPPEEYPVDPQILPIRKKSDKLSHDSQGNLKLAAKTTGAAWIVVPNDPVISALHEAALACYRALGCRQYGLFDFRVDDTGTPWFLEAGLYCSFSPQSVICVMAKAAGIELHTLFDEMAAQAISTAKTYSNSNRETA